MKPPTSPSPPPPPHPVSRLLLFLPRLTHLLSDQGGEEHSTLSPDDSSSSSTVLSKVLVSRLYGEGGEDVEESAEGTLKFLGLVEALVGFSNNPAIFPGSVSDSAASDSAASDVTVTLASGSVALILSLSPSLTACLLLRPPLPSSLPPLIASRFRELFAESSPLREISGAVEEYISEHRAAAYYGLVKKIGKLCDERLWRSRNDGVEGGRMSELTIEESDGSDGSDGSDRSGEDGEGEVPRRRRSIDAMSGEIDSLTAELAGLASSSPMPAARLAVSLPASLLLSSLLSTFFPPPPSLPPPSDPPLPPRLSLPSVPPLSSLLALPSPSSHPSSLAGLDLSYFHQGAYLYSTFPIGR